MKRRTGREIVLKTLFARDFSKNDAFELLEHVMADEKVDEPGREFSRSLVEGVLSRQKEIDNLIKQYSIEWDLDRMAAVDRNIMRIALFEILFSPNMPEAVAANEAIELAKNFGSDESAKFVNGILGKIIKDLPTVKAMFERGC